MTIPSGIGFDSVRWPLSHWRACGTARPTPLQDAAALRVVHLAAFIFIVYILYFIRRCTAGRAPRSAHYARHRVPGATRQDGLPINDEPFPPCSCTTSSPPPPATTLSSSSGLYPLHLLRSPPRVAWSWSARIESAASSIAASIGVSRSPQLIAHVTQRRRNLRSKYKR